MTRTDQNLGAAQIGARAQADVESKDHALPLDTMMIEAAR
jgi:hypothetical protein